MTRTISLSKPPIMGVEQIKETLHLRIEQADEKLLSVLAELTESLFKTYQPEALEEEEITDEEIMAILPPPGTRLTMDELIAEIEEADAECDRGEFISSEDLEKEMEKW